MAESKFIDNKDEDIETAILFPKVTAIENKPENAKNVNHKRPIWKPILVGAFIFILGFAAPFVIDRLHRHFHRRGHFGHHDHPRDHPRDHPHEPDEMMKMHKDKYFDNEKMKGPGGMKSRKHPHDHPDEMMKMHKDKYFDNEKMKGPGGMKSRKHPREPDEMMKMHKDKHNKKMKGPPPMYDSRTNHHGMKPHDHPRDPHDHSFSASISSSSDSSSDSMDEEEPEVIIDYIIMEPVPEMEEESFSPKIDIDPEDSDIDFNNDLEKNSEEEFFMDISREEESP